MGDNKIYIIGPVGSGKTTLSRLLSEKYSIESYELDKIVWNDDNGNIKRTDEEIAKMFNEIISKDSWIIEDVGRKKFFDGIKNADIVYYIDLPKSTIYKRCISRWIRQNLHAHVGSGLDAALGQSVGEVAVRSVGLVHHQHRSVSVAHFRKALYV